MRAFILIFVAISTCMFTACRGKDGLVGPQGQKGDTGNANVKVITKTIAASEWTANSYWYSKTFTIPEITDAISKKGAVLGFIKINNGTSYWLPMPWISSSQSADYSVVYEFNYTTNLLQLVYKKVDDTYSSPNVPSGNYELKFIIIESSGLKTDKPSSTDYDSVMKFYGLSTT